MDKTIAAYAEENGLVIGVCGTEGLAVEFAGSVFVVCSPIPAAPPPEGGLGERGEIAAAMSGADYHVRVKNELNNLKDFLTGLYGAFEYFAQADDGRIKERPLAVMSGAAYQGLNRCVYTDKFGSYFNLGILVTSLELPHDKPRERFCLKCGKCKAACPMGALTDFGDENGGFIRERCLANITQRKNPPTDEAAAKMGKRLWGCDTCQQVCPLNAGHIVRGDRPVLNDILHMDEETFKARFPAMAWRGAEVLKRNAGIALNNIKR